MMMSELSHQQLTDIEVWAGTLVAEQNYDLGFFILSRIIDERARRGTLQETEPDPIELASVNYNPNPIEAGTIDFQADLAYCYREDTDGDETLRTWQQVLAVVPRHDLWGRAADFVEVLEEQIKVCLKNHAC